MQDCDENSWKLKASSRTHSAIKARKFDGAVWTLIELCVSSRESILKLAIEPVGVQDSRLYDGASPGTIQASWCSSVLAGNARRDRALPNCLQAKQPADVDDGEGIVRPIASPGAIALTPRIPHS